MRFYSNQRQSGLTLVELIIVAGITVTIFAGLFASVQYTFHLINNSSARLSALSLANDRMEFFRSLPYDEVGTIAGIPAGAIPQNSTTTLNQIEFSERVLVEYVDDDADGVLTATTTDSNGIPSDYKRVKVEISWTLKDQSDSVSVVSNIVPRSIETTAGGGTVRVNVLDAESSFLPGAEVRLLNEATAPMIDVTRLSDASGIALFSGAPAASDYQVFVTAPGYSTDQTYVATTSNPNPVTAPFAVLESDISTVTFQIGELSDILLATLSDVTEGSALEPFTDTSGIASSTDVVINAGALQLSGAPGSYVSDGEAVLKQVVPGALEAWENFLLVGQRPGGTDYRVRFYTGTSTTFVPVNNSDLPGNATGFTEDFIDLSELDISSYPDLTAVITLESTNPANTPRIAEASFYYRTGETARPNVYFEGEGLKVIGEELDLTPIKKVSFATTTDGSGQRTLPDIEFDSYTFSSTTGLSLARACPNVPLNHQAGATSTLELVLVPEVAESLRVYVEADAGYPLPGAEVSLSRPGFSDTLDTDACGQAFFSTGVTANNDFVLTITRDGFDPLTINPYDLAGNSEVTVTLNET